MSKTVREKSSAFGYPSVRSSDAFTRLKYPSKPTMHRRSTERSKNSSRSLSSSPARRGVPTSTCSFPCSREYAGARLARPASVALLRAEHPRVLLELERSLVQEVLGDGVVFGRDRHRMANGGDRRRERRDRAADRLGTVE